MGKRKITDVSAWLHARINKTETCWLWTGSVSSGYGITRYSRNKSTKAHREIYQIYKGAIPEGFEIDHLCRNTLCVNPEHLEAVTKKVNVLRGFGACAKNARKTHCKNGHEFTPENTVNRGDTYRRCLACKRISGRNRMRRIRQGTP